MEERPDSPESFPYRPGDTVLITNREQLRIILDEFSPTHDCITPFTIEEVADQYATLVDLIRNPDPKLGLGTFAVLLLEDGQDVVLPLTAFRFIQIEIKEDIEEEDVERLNAAKEAVISLNHNPSAMSSNLDLVQSIAAEYIQSAYRRYRACKNAIKERRKKSTEQLVLNLAAETITKNLKRVLSRGKSKLELEKLRDSRNNSIAGSEITLSLPNTERRNSKFLNDLSPRPDISLPMPSIPIPPNATSTSKDGDVFILSNLSINDIPSASWNNDNRIYALIEYNLNNCLRRTETQTFNGKSSHQQLLWSGNVISVPVSASINDKLHNGELLKVFIYHECLAIQDKLLGLLEVFLPSLYLDDSSSSGKKNAIINHAQYVGDLYDSTNLVKRKRKGMISFDWMICKGKPSDSNYSPRVNIRDDVSKISKISALADQRLDSNSVTTKFIDVNDNQHDVNGLSPSLVLAAANTLHSWENNEDIENPYYEEAKVYVPKPSSSTTGETLSNNKNKVMNHNDLMKNRDHKHFERSSSDIKKTKANKALSPQSDRDVRTTRMRKDHKKGIAMSEEELFINETNNHVEQTLTTSEIPKNNDNFQRPKLERALSHNSESTNNAYSVLTEKTKKSVGSIVTNNTMMNNLLNTTAMTKKQREIFRTDKDKDRDNNKKKKSMKGSSGRGGFKIEHDIQCIFDQAFYMALLKVSASFTIRMKELIVLLDSLDIPVNPDFLMIDSDSNLHHQSAANDINGKTAWLDEYVQLPVNHSTSFAATIADILEQRPYILANHVSLNTVILSESQSILAIKQLIHLIKGPYLQIRDSVFSACGSPLLLNDKQQFTSTGQVKGKHPLVSRRPRKFASDGMYKILNSMKVVRSNYSEQEADGDAANSFITEIFQNMDGKEFLDLSSTVLSSHYHITASVLQARFLAYQYTLQIIDSAWDRGIRPEDSVSNTDTGSTISSAAVSNSKAKENSDAIESGGNRKEKTIRRKSATGSVVTNETKASNGRVKEEVFDDFIEITVVHPSNNNVNSSIVYSALGTPQHVHTIRSPSSHDSPSSSNGGASSLGTLSTIKRSNKHYFQIADANQLFQAYMSHNRAYGWGFSLANLTGLSNAIGGFFGYQIDGSGLLTTVNGTTSGANNGSDINSVISMPQTVDNSNVFPTNRDMIWLMLDFPSEEVKSMTLHSLQSLLIPSLVQQSTAMTMGGSTSLSPFLMQIVSVVPVNAANTNAANTLNNQNNDYPAGLSNLGATWGSFANVSLGVDAGAAINAGGGMIQTELCVHIMRRCCTIANPLKSTVPNNGSLHKGTDLLFRRIKHLSVDELKLGMEARVVNFSMLQRLCDRYDWFDKPSEDILHQFASKKVEIVSLAELIGKQRVGVRLVKTNICDAIPIEALLPIPISTLSAVVEGDHSSSNNNLRKKKDVDDQWVGSSGVDMRKKLEISQKVKDNEKSLSKEKKKKAKRRSHDSDEHDDDSSSSEGQSLELDNLSLEEKKAMKKQKTIATPNYTRPKSANAVAPPKATASSNGKPGPYHLDSKRTGGQIENQEPKREKDLFWMKPVPKVHTQLFQFDEAGLLHGSDKAAGAAMVVEDVISPRADSPMQVPNPDESIPIQSAPAQHKLNVWEAVLDLKQAEYTHGMIPSPGGDSPTHFADFGHHRTKPKSGKSSRPSSAKATVGSKTKKSMEQDEGRHDPITMGVAGAGFNPSEGKWNDPVVVMPPTTIATGAVPVGNKRPQSALHQKPVSNAAKAYTPYQDRVPEMTLPSESEQTGLLGVSLHINNAPRAELHPSTTSPRTRSPPTTRVQPVGKKDDVLLATSPSGREMKFGVNVKTHRSPGSPEEQDRLFEKVTSKVDEIRQKPKSLQEALYYNREMARTEREAHRTEEVLRKELKRYGVRLDSNEPPTNEDHQEKRKDANK